MMMRDFLLVQIYQGIYKRKEYYEKINKKLNIENRDINNLNLDNKIDISYLKKIRSY